MQGRRRTVLLFGTSANPPTGLQGHAGIVRWAATEAHVRFPQTTEAVRADEVWVLPVFHHPFTEKHRMPSFEDRLAMAHLAFDRLSGAEGRVFIKDTERTVHLEAASRSKDAWAGTIDVVRHLIREHPSTRFALLLGQDTYRDLATGKWKEAPQLTALVPIVVVAREGAPEITEAGAIAPEQVPGLSDVSSSQIRATTDRSVLERALQPEVLSYIESRGLYAFGSAR
jgi:nicotinate (nicotinamide) nucleotide adenylyltransferase